MDEDPIDRDQPQLATFEKHNEFLNYQNSILSSDLNNEPNSIEDKNEIKLIGKLSDILDEYQEQSYLLDPFLEHLIVPAAERLKTHAKSFVSNPAKQVSATRVGRLGLLLYTYIKFRGYKTIIRFFPHEIADMSIALNYMLTQNTPAQDPSNWPLRYVILLWLSLVCMIPFDLAQFDNDDEVDHTAVAIESLAKGYLSKAGLEREGAAILLSRLFIRKDTRTLFDSFLNWSNNLLGGAIDVFTSIGILEVLCEVVKSGPAEQILVNLASILHVCDTISQSETHSSNTIVRKLKTKLLSRISFRLLPVKSNVSRNKGRILRGPTPAPLDDFESENDVDVPDEVEAIIEQLMQSLQDKDTIVRWSASKGIARISERLPIDFSNQVLDTIIELFTIHSTTAASLYDIPAIAENTWHGACLACAEMSRRNLVGREKLPELIGWLSKALYFDVRKGAHSIGSSVRDAAAYVLWALARTQDGSALVPHAVNLAGRLVTVALYDREIHIRRAASAAFQEHVGRMSLFPHGIDVLRKTDFYSVSVRRNAFLDAAPGVAEHIEYRAFLFDHLLNITARHWDTRMRELGSQSLRRICSSELMVLGPQASSRAAQLFNSVDLNDIHGGLLVLTEIAAAYREFLPSHILEGKLQDTFKYLAVVPSTVIFAPRNGLVTVAACHLISNTITLTEIRLGEKSSVPHWRKIIDHGVKHRSGEVQEAAASAMASVSRLVDCSSDMKRCVSSTLIPELKSGPSRRQQSLGGLIAALDYTAFPHGLSEAVQCLLECVTNSSPTKLQNIEARRNCYLAMPRILRTIAPQVQQHLSSHVIQSLFEALRDGLNDYTMDERGDVGSWIRIACIQGLTSFSQVLFSQAGDITNFEEYLPSALYHEAVGGILKQGVERLDGVRQEAGENFVRLLLIPPLAMPSGRLWCIQGEALMKELFLGESQTLGWNDGGWLFPKAVQLLGVEKYRKQILAGLVLSIGSKTESTRSPASRNLVSYSNSLPMDGPAYSLPSLIQDLADHAKAHLNTNAIIVPVLQTFNCLLEADTLQRLSRHPNNLNGVEMLFSVSSKNVPRLKNVPRIMESMKILANLLAFQTFFERCVLRLPDFLAHHYPKIRAETAEYLYLALQTREVGCETDKIEEILLETEWSSADIQVAEQASCSLRELFLIQKGADLGVE